MASAGIGADMFWNTPFSSLPVFGFLLRPRLLLGLGFFPRACAGEVRVVLHGCCAVVRDHRKKFWPRNPRGITALGSLLSESESRQSAINEEGLRTMMARASACGARSSRRIVIFSMRGDSIRDDRRSGIVVVVFIHYVRMDAERSFAHGSYESSWSQNVTNQQMTWSCRWTRWKRDGYFFMLTCESSFSV